jgi:hypothetical protein
MLPLTHRRRLIVPVLFAFAGSFAVAAEKSPAATMPVAAAAQPSQAARRTAALLKELKLTDAAQEAKVRSVLESHFVAMEEWHASHDSALTPLWSEWAARRSPPEKDEAAAAKVGEKIDAIYASFRPRRDAFLAALGQELSPAQIDTIKNSLTRSPGMDRTANAYIEMIPQFTAADKAFVHERFAMAREQAIDTTTGKEVEAFFKRQKVVVEAYIDEKGYDYRKSREAWITKMNAANAATKAADAAKQR